MTDTTGAGVPISRRRFVALAAGTVAAAVTEACGPEAKEPSGPPSAAVQGRLLARPAAPTRTASPGLRALGLSTGRDGLLYVPAGYRPDQPAPLVVMLHGAGGNASQGLLPFRDQADDAGLVLLAPQSRYQTWDVVQVRGYGPDVDFIDQALALAFDNVAVDPARVAIEGFSDGASYALSLGLINGDLFSRVVAFSPGGVAAGTPHGKPRFFITHGTQDQILSVAVTRDQIVPQLLGAGYEVQYREFDGPHAVPATLAVEAVHWLAGSQGGVVSGPIP